MVPLYAAAALTYNRQPCFGRVTRIEGYRLLAAASQANKPAASDPECNGPVPAGQVPSRCSRASWICCDDRPLATQTIFGGALWRTSVTMTNRPTGCPTVAGRNRVPGGLTCYAWNQGSAELSDLMLLMLRHEVTYSK